MKFTFAVLVLMSAPVNADQLPGCTKIYAETVNQLVKYMRFESGEGFYKGGWLEMIFDDNDARDPRDGHVITSRGGRWKDLDAAAYVGRANMYQMSYYRDGVLVDGGCDD
jgi:hypothetical protein